MRQKSGPAKEPAAKIVKDIRRATRRQFSAEEKIRIVLEGLRGEESIAELCRREGIVQNLYYRWSKDFLEAGKKRLAGDTARAATSDEVKDLRREASALKEVVAELTLENRLLKKSVTGDGEDELAAIPKKFNLPLIHGLCERAKFPSDPGMLAHRSEGEVTLAAHVVTFVACSLNVENTNDEICLMIVEDNQQARQHIKRFQNKYQQPDTAAILPYELK